MGRCASGISLATFVIMFSSLASFFLLLFDDNFILMIRGMVQAECGEMRRFVFRERQNLVHAASVAL